MTLPESFKDVYGPWAVVTGASAGIGNEFARQLAAAGLSVAAVARRADKLAALRDELTAAHGVQVLVVVADLSAASGAQAVLDATAELDVGLVVNNAGVDLAGAFAAHDAGAVRRVVDLNVAGFTAVAHGFAGRLVRRTRAAAQSRELETSRAGFINVGSMANNPMPYCACYAASKAYVSTLSVGLRAELAPDRVDVMVLEPGPVVSEMSARARNVIDVDRMGVKPMPVEACVGETLAAFHAGGTARFVPGMMNRIAKFVTGLLPESVVVRMFGGYVKSAMAPEIVDNLPKIS